MSGQNRPVTSREYKLMLRPELFLERKNAVKTFRDLAKILVDREGGQVIQDQKKVKQRLTWYVDSDGWDLRRLSLVLRVRREKRKGKTIYKVTLKYRSGDRYLSAMSTVNSEADDCKFEEDLTPPYASKFSHSCSVKLHEEPILKTMDDAIKLFPGLKQMLDAVPGDTPLSVVNGFKAQEFSCYLLQAQFGGKEGKETPVKLCMSFWYFEGTDQGCPLATEFSYDFDATKSPEGNLEEFSKPVLVACNAIFKSMYNMDAWIKTRGTTKTKLAYEGV